jgi:hypothetical protein
MPDDKKSLAKQGVVNLVERTLCFAVLRDNIKDMEEDS